MAKNWRRESPLKKLIDPPLTKPWSGGQQTGSPASSPPPLAHLWQAQGHLRANSQLKTYSPSQQDDPSVFPDPGGELCLPRTAIVTSQGTLSLRLSHGMRIDMTIDRSLRLISFKNNIIIAMNPTGSACALIHPNGRVHQYGSRVEIMANDERGNNKFAKMWYKGVSFTAENCPLVYLVDSAGTRTTTDTFSDLKHDFSYGTFYSEARYGQEGVPEAVNIVQATEYSTAEDGNQSWTVNNVKITQAPDGLVRVSRNLGKYSLRCSPTSGNASITTPFLHCTASLGDKSHLFVRRGERRLHYDGSAFIVRNAGHSAGFDDKTQLKVY